MPLNQMAPNQMPLARYMPSFFPEEKCGVFGVFGKNLEAARLVHSGLWSLQHRGQESSGITSCDGTHIRTYKDIGLVSRVFSEQHLSLLAGHAAIGHNRYATSKKTHKNHMQPISGTHNSIALAHNGNIPDTSKLENHLAHYNIDTRHMNDSEMIHAAIEHQMSLGSTATAAIKKIFPKIEGVFCLLLLTRKQLIAVRDCHGIRPLSLGSLNGGYVVSSETCALDTIGATFVRDVAPGEMIVLSHKNGTTNFKSYTLAKGSTKLDIFEFVYFSRSDSILLGKRVDSVRKNLGKQLAKEHTITADVVIPVPDSAISAALGFSQASGIPFDLGLIKNRYIHRTFIQPAQRLREKSVSMKLNPIPDVVAGKNVALIDDSIVRGTTAKQLISRIKSAGAKKIHMLISCPPVMYPDFYGIDTPNQKDLIAFQLSVAKIKKYIGADSLHFLSYKGLIAATELPETTFSTSCFTGIYPCSIGKRATEVKLSSP